MSAKNYILKQLLNKGFVGNYECIDRRITTRLAAQIYNLRNKGLRIHTSEKFEGTKNTIYYLASSKEKAKVKQMLKDRKG